MSVLVPAYNEEAMVLITVRSVLAFDYPELEVIIVDDGSTDRTFEVLDEELDLEPFGYYERRIVECAPVTGVYRSRKHEHVKVIRKENQGTKADACNCGLNYARYRYVLLLDGDTLYEPDALLNCMRLAASDPQRVIGITGHISVASQPETTIGARVEDRELIDKTLLSNFQHLEYLRSFLNTTARLEPARLHDVRQRRVRPLAARRRRGGRRLVDRVQLRGHRADVPRARAHAPHRPAVPDPLDPGDGRADGGARAHRRARLAARALAARDARDVLELPADDLRTRATGSSGWSASR